ncbi:MAG: glycoside hydrolase family 99-like domain-containing protein [Anaerolineales bacterium]|nr:glycoside hydrolase family 99-like domain-containing protein [Anaerolineales bacterium]
MTTSPVRALAFYLPQYHPIPENDGWWGKGFTEWRNVAQARPRFRGHAQPHLPADLGFYDLRVPEARAAQAELARAHELSGFVYYHYWFNGRRLLERPLDEVLALGRPDFPFCLCWANESWTRNWDGQYGVHLIQQQYSPADDQAHVAYLLRVFADPRYIRVDGRPLLLIYRTHDLPDPAATATAWRQAAQRAGWPDLYLCQVESNFAAEHSDPTHIGFDASVEFQPDVFHLGEPLQRGRGWQRLRRARLASRAYADNSIFDYGAVVERMLAKPLPAYPYHRCVTPAWDNSARRAKDAFILKDSHPALYERWLREVVSRAAAGPQAPLVFINAWNEWAEGCHLEPDQRHGRAYLEATRRAIEAGNGLG